jgi:histidinol phosphatase-like enzyme (inositol monophosphatase family)
VNNFDTKKYPIFAKFLNQLAKDLTSFYYSKLNRTFKVSNKLKGKGYDPVTTSDKAFEKLIRFKIKKKFPNHQVIGEEFGHKKSKSEFTWVIDPIDGTRSFVIGSPTWSNLISLNHLGSPIIGLVNFPILKKYYLNETDKNAYVFENGKKRKLKVNIDAKFKGIKLTAAFHGNLSFKQQEKISKILQLNNFPTSDALSYMQVADGTLDIAIQCGNHIWDIHPSIPIIKAAGGVVTNWRNEKIIKRDNTLVSANKLVHKKILKLLSPLKKI